MAILENSKMIYNKSVDRSYCLGVYLSQLKKTKETFERGNTNDK